MRVVFADKARKEFFKFDKPIQKQIQAFVVRLQEMQNPRSIGKALVGNFAGFWRYRVGDYRLVCVIEDEKILITVLHMAHRKDIYN